MNKELEKQKEAIEGFSLWRNKKFPHQVPMTIHDYEEYLLSLENNVNNT